MTTRPPLPPCTQDTAAQKARLAEDAWNTCDPERVASAYTEDRGWRNSAEFFTGRETARLFHWPLGPRPADHPGLSELGL